MADGVKVGEAYVEIHPEVSAVANELPAQGRKMGQQLGDGISQGAADGVDQGFKRDVNGKLRDSRGRFVEEGKQSGKLFGDAAGKEASNAIGDVLKAGAFIGGTKLAIDQAKRLEQAVGGTSAVFKDNAAQIETFAKSASKNLGLSEAATRELTAQIGGALKGYGFDLDEATEKSQQLTTLGGDLAATFGGDPKEAVEALSAALRGEFDPLERYAIAINQTLIDQKAVDLGLASSTSNVDQHARAQAALALIVERSGDAQGQFAREANTASGASSIAAAEAENSAAKLGTNLLPVYGKAVELAGTAAEKFGALPGPLQTVTLALVALTALSGPLGNIKDRVTGLASAIHSGELGSSKLAATGTAVAGLAVAYGILADKVNEYAQEADAAAKQGREQNLDQGFVALQDRALRVQQQALGLEQELNEIRSDPVKNAVNLDYVLGLEKQIEALGREGAQLSKVQEQAVALSDATGANVDETTRWLGEQAALGKTFNSTQEAIDAYTKSTDTAKSAAEKNTEQAKLSAEAHKALADRVNEAYDAYQSIIGTSLSYTEAQRDVTTKVQELVDLQRSGTANANDYALAQEDLLKAADAQAQAAVKEADAQAALEGKVLSASEKARIYKDELDKLGQKFPGLAGLLDQFKDQIDKIPDNKNVDINLRINDLTEGIAAGLADVNDGNGGGLLGGLRRIQNAIPGRAGGGSVDANRPYLVGEDGPELMVPNQSGTILPNGVGGTTLVQNIHGSGLNSAEVAEVSAQRLAIALEALVGAA